MNTRQGQHTWSFGIGLVGVGHGAMGTDAGHGHCTLDVGHGQCTLGVGHCTLDMYILGQCWALVVGRGLGAAGMGIGHGQWTLYLGQRTMCNCTWTLGMYVVQWPRTRHIAQFGHWALGIGVV